uniref:Amidase domain-containing protein n=1 Tax=Gadus morhua TaxID=8049 RepID=A0A8C5F9M4_GADMO
MKPNWTRVVISTLCGTCLIGLLVKWIHRVRADSLILKARNRRETNLLQAEEVVRDYNDSHPGAYGCLIHSLSARQLTLSLKEGSLVPEDVLFSYMTKALEANKRLNCCTEIMMESLNHSKSMDSYKDGLLYGVPVSIKDNVGCKGYDSTCGLLCRLNQPALEDSVIVEVLRRQGAIPFVKTNVPQSLMSYECSNPIYGTCVNPHNPKKTPGGSSGGEGALIKGGGSLLGIGTDIGGSIRIPCSFSGICGLKPTCNRLSTKGISSSVKGQTSVKTSVGPMARDVDSLALCMQALLSDHMFTLDPTVPPIPFNTEVYQSSKPLRIGYYENDGYQHPSPSMLRGVREVKALLERAGHTFVAFKPLKMEYAMNDLIIKAFFSDGSSTLLKLVQNWPIIEYIRETIDEWKRCDLDVLLCPVIGPAFNHNYSAKLVCALSSTLLFNLLSFPAGVVPVSSVTPADEILLKQFKGNFQDLWDREFVQAVKGGEGLPVAVQCVALPWQEELCLRFMKEVETLLTCH